MNARKNDREIEQYFKKIDSVFTQEIHERIQLLNSFGPDDTFAREYFYGTVNFGSKCNLGCFYCSQEYMPEGLAPKNIKFLPVDTIKKYLKLVPRHINNGFRVIDNLGSTTWTWAGEIFLHPNTLECLKYIKDENIFVTSIATNGMLITEDIAKVLKEIVLPNQGGDLGVHVCNYNQTKTGLDWLDKYEVPYAISIVPTRSQLKNGRIEKWIEQLQVHNPDYISVLKPSYTKHDGPRGTAKINARQMDISDEELKFYVSNWSKEYPKIRINYQSRIDLAEIMVAIERYIKKMTIEMKLMARKVPPRILFLKSAAVEEIFGKVLEFLKQNHHYNISANDNNILQNSKDVTVENLTFGGNCNVSGLLMVDDYVAAIDKIISDGFDPEFIVMPKESFIYDNKDLKRVPATVIGEKYKINTAWI